MDLAAIWRPSHRMQQLLDIALIGSIVAVGWAGQIAAIEDPSVEAGEFSVPLALFAVGAAIPLWWRRRRPLGMLGITLVVVVAATAVDPAGLFGGQIFLCGVVLLFAIGAWSRRRIPAALAIVALVVVVVAGALVDGTNVVAAAAYGVAFVALPAVAGFAMRTRREYVAEVEQRLAAAERTKEEQAHLAVVDERHRIARELHDVVAHHVSLMGVQAAAARAALDRSPDRAREALAQIEASSRGAVGEMHQLLNVLAPVGVEGVEPPQPGLERLEALIERWCAAGIEVEAFMSGDPATVAPTVSLCCYRVVEEALTNVARHSAGKSAKVIVAIGPDVELEIANPGPAKPATASSGRGLVGMRQRVELCGGHLDAGPGGDGSFTVKAVVPSVPE